jgi:DNA-binding beta-propeller fold protein YncE
VYVSNNSGGDVTRINTGDGSTTDIATGGSPRNMALSSDGSTVYVALQSDEIAVIAVADDAVSTITFPTGSCTYGVAIVPGSDLGYVTDECNDEVYTFDAASAAPGATITDDGFATPRAIAALGVQPPEPPPTEPTTTSPSNNAATTAVTPRFTG